jgi:hypothetical protein
MLATGLDYVKLSSLKLSFPRPVMISHKEPKRQRGNGLTPSLSIRIMNLTSFPGVKAERNSLRGLFS